MNYSEAVSGFDGVRQILEPVLLALPDFEHYLYATENIRPNLVCASVKKGYSKATAKHDDYWAFDYLIFLAHRGERKCLLQLLKDRLLAIYPDRFEYRKAYVATAELARDFLRDEFDHWYRKNIDREYPHSAAW
jgi:hypothetical protein